MKVFLAGSSDFAIPTLMELAEASTVNLMGVFTQPPQKKGRGMKLQPTPLAEKAKELGIKVIATLNINSEEYLQLMQDHKIDALIVVAFGQKIAPLLLDLPPKGAINLHGSKLPAYRGANPIQRALLNGENETGLTVIKMDSGWDSGPILNQMTVEINATDTFKSLYQRLRDLGGKFLLETLLAYQKGKLEPQKQQGTVSFAPKLTSDEYQLNWYDIGEAIERKIRAFNPYPLARTFYHDEELRIWESELYPENQHPTPGTILKSNKELLIQTQQGIIAIKKLQRRGKKPLLIKDFLAGFPLKVGERLGDRADK